jgi:hypothetical protein
MPDGIRYIIVNDIAERFSFYGMKGILVIFMTQYLMSTDGQLATMSRADATSYFHLFMSTTYFLPIIGAVIADSYSGKYRTVILLSARRLLTAHPFDSWRYPSEEQRLIRLASIAASEPFVLPISSLRSLTNAPDPTISRKL